MFEPFGSDKMRTTKALTFQTINLPGVSNLIQIPEGFVFDGASIPQFCWSVIGAPFEPDFQIAACVHDWICERANEAHDYSARIQGDGIFFVLLSQAGVPRWKRAAMYLAVRLHSWTNYGRTETTSPALSASCGSAAEQLGAGEEKS